MVAIKKPRRKIKKVTENTEPIIEENVLSLRQKRKLIDVDWTRVLGFYKEHHNGMFASVSVVLIFSIIFVFSIKTHALVTNFYSNSCLGGWENPSNTQGEPNAIGSTESNNLFSKKNSAFLYKTNGEIFCGDFKGETPESTRPNKATVKLSLFITDKELPEKEESTQEKVDGILNDTSETPIENNTTPVEVEPVKEESENIIDSINESITPTEQNITNENETTFLDKIIPTVYAQEESPTIEPSVIVEQAPTEVVPTPAPSVPNESIQNEIISIESNTEVSKDNNTDSNVVSNTDIAPILSESEIMDATPSVAPKEEVIPNLIIDPSTTIVQEENKRTNDVLEVIYSFDGVDWKTLGTINRETFTDISFDLPIDELDWNIISKLQISVRTIPTIDIAPVFYLDSIYLVVEYEGNNETIVEPPTISLIDPELSLLSGDLDFSADEDIVFTVTDPNFTNKELRNLADENKIEIIKDEHNFFFNKEEGKESTSVSTFPDVTSESVKVIETPLNMSGPSDAVESIKNLINTNEIGGGSTQIENPILNSAPSIIPETLDTPNVNKEIDGIPSEIIPTPTVEVIPAENIAPTESSDPQARIFNSVKSNFSYEKIIVDNHFKNSFNLPIKTEKIGDLPRLGFIPYVLAQESITDFKDTVTAEVFDPNGKLSDVTISIQTVVVDGEEKAEVHISRPSYQFKPGKYSIKVTLQKANATIISEQDFTWGVLTINVDKSIYAPGEKAYLQMGVLNEGGHTLCMADLNLEIKSPSGNIKNFSSDIPTPLGQEPIIRDPECGPDNVISVPDYYAHYDIPTELGVYEMTLTATTANGDKTIHDTFVVSDNEVFDISRVGPTRIYPVATYPVQIKIKSKSDWSGVVQEYAPESFDISHPSIGKDYNNITTFNNLKIISWNVEIKAGEEVVLGYLFNAPDISPEMFLLGKVKLFEFAGGTAIPQLVFQESRKWQIASDGVNRYWVGGTGTWDSSSTTHWASSSGGASGASAPTSVDNVFIDGNSGAGVITPSGSITMLDLDFTGYTGTFTPAGTITVSGSINIASGMTLTSVAQGWTLNATDSRTLTFNGKSMGAGFFNFNGVGGTWTLQDAWTSTANNTLTNGTLDTNGKTVTIASLQSNFSNTRGLTLGASTINLTTTGGVWNVRTTNLTFNAGTSTINCTSTSAIQFGVSSSYPMTFYDVNFTAVTATVNLIAAHTYHNLTLTQAAVKTGAVTLTANQTVTNLFTASGNSTVNRLFVQSDTAGTSRTITAASVSISNADFLDITASGAASPFTGTSVGSCGNNTNITGDTPTTRYWVGGTGNWADTTEWSASSGGASGASVPLCHDSVIFNASSFSAGSQTVTVNMARLGKDINFTGVTNTPTVSFNTQVTDIFGSLTLVSGMTVNGSQTVQFTNRSAVTLTSAGRTFAGNITVNSGSSSFSLADTLNLSTRVLTLTSGTFNTNNNNLTMGQFNASSGTLTRVINMGSGTWTIDTNSASSPFSVITTNTTLNAETSTIKFQEATGGSTAHSFSGGSGSTFYNVWFTTALSGTSTYALTIVGSNTFNDFKWDRTDATATNLIKFSAGSTTTVNTFTVSGVDATHQVTINSDNTATHNLVKIGGGTINRDYLNIQHSVATPASTWYAGTNSTNNQATATAGSGWIFTAAPTACVATGTGTWGGTDTANFTGCTGAASGGSGTGARPGTGDALTINSGVTITLSTNTPVLGVLTLDGTLDTSGTNYSLSATNININSTGTLTANASTITSSATSGVAFYKHSSGTFTYGTSTFTFTGDGAFTNPNFITSANATSFYNLTFSPTLSAARTYTFGNGAVTVNGNFDSNPSGGGSARALTTILGSGGMTIVGTFTLEGTSSGTSTFDTGSGLNYSLTFSTVNITSGDTLNTRGSAVNITGTSGTLITNSGTWTTPVTPSVTTLSGNGSATVNTAALTFFNLTSSGTGTKTLAASITTTVSNVLTVSAGTFALGTSSTLTLSGTTGTPFVCSATCDGGTGTIQYTGANASGNTTVDTTGVTYYNLTFNASDTFVLDGGLTGNASATLTITTGTLDTTASNFAISIGKISIANSANAILTANTSTISLTATSGTLFTRGASGVFNYGTSLVDLTGNGSATITSGTVTFYDLRSSGTGTKTMSSAITVNHDLTINAGSFEPGLILATGSGTNVLTVASGATLNVGSSTFANNYTSFETMTFSSGSTVDYNRAGAQTVDSTLSYANLTFSGTSGTKSMNGTTTALGTVNISGGNTLDAVSGSNYNLNAYYFTISAGVYNMQQSTLTLSGTSGTLFTKSGGTFTVGTSSTVVMNPDSTSTLTSGTITFNNLTLSPTITTSRVYTFGASTLTINGDFNINPTAASAYALQVNLGASTTVAATKTTTITRTTSATSELNTTSGGSYAFSSGKWSIQTGGTLTANASALTLTATSGTLITFAGSFSGGTSTLTLNGGTSTINSGAMTGSNALGNLTLNLTAATFTLGANLEATGLTTITLGTLDTDITNNYTFTTGSISISNTASAIFNARASTVNLSGTSGTLFTRATSGVFTYGTSTVVLTGNGNATLNSGTLTFYNLSQTGTGVKTVGAAITINNNFTVSGGTFDPTASYTITGSGTNILTGNSGGTLRVGASTFGGNYSSFETRTLNSGSTVDYYVNGAQTVDSTLSYANLSISVGNTKSLNGTTTATGATTIDTATLDTVNGSNYALNSDTLIIQNSGTLRARNSTITLSGTSNPVFTNNANFTADTSNLKFTGDGAPTLFSGTFTGASAPYDLELAPVLGADRIYSGGVGVSPSHNFTIDPSSGVSGRTLTYNLGGNNIITGTLLVQPGAISVNAIVDTTSGGNYSLTANNIDLQTRATLVGNASTITLTGTTGTLFSLTGTGAFTYGTSTVVFNPNASATLTSGAITFYNLSLTPTITADRIYTFGSSTLTVNGDFNINPTASSGFVLTVNPGADISVASTKTTTITGTTSALSSLDLRPFATDYNLTTGFINIGATGTLDATSGAPSVTVNGTSGTLFTSTGTFTAGNSTTIMNGNASLTLTSGAISFYNLNLTPTITTGRTYTFGSGTTTINGDFNINPTASSTLLLTVNMGGTITQAALKSITITGTTSGTSKLDTVSGSNYTLNAGSIIINSAGTLIANNSNITVGKNWTNAGTFTAGNSTVTLNTGTTSTVDGGPTTFYNLAITHTTAKQVNFSDNALHIIHVTGAFTITGHVAGLITLYSSSPGNQWHLHPTGTASADYVTVQDGGCEAGYITIYPTHSNDGLNNGPCWVFPVDVSGTVFMSDEVTQATTGNGGFCDGSTQNLTLRVNGANPITTYCDSSTGDFSFGNNVSAIADDVITIYSTDASQKANRVYLSDGTADGGVGVYIDVVSVSYFANGPVQMADLAIYDSTTNATDMMYDATVSPDTLTVDTDKELHVESGSDFTPGGDVTASRLHVIGTYNAGSDTINLTGTSGTLLTMDVAGTFNYGTSVVVIDPDADATLTSGTVTLYDLDLTPTITADKNYTFGSGTVSIFNNLDINPTASSAYRLTTILGDTLIVSGTTTITGTTSGVSTLNTTGSNYPIISGTINLASAGTLTANGSDITVNATSGTLFTRSGTFNYDSSNFKVSSDANVTVLSGTATFYNLSFNPTITTSRTYTIGSSAITINNDLYINATASSADTLLANMGNTISVGGITSILGSGSGIAELNTISGSNYALTSGIISLQPGGTLTANDSNITINDSLSLGSPMFDFQSGATFNYGTSKVIINVDNDETLTSGYVEFYELEISPTTTDNRIYSFGTEDVTIHGDFNIIPDLSSGKDLNVNLGGILIVDPASLTLISPTGSSGNAYLDTTASNYAFTTGNITIDNNFSTFKANASTVTINGDTTPFTNNGGNFDSGTSTVAFSNSAPAAGGGLIPFYDSTGTITFYNLEFIPFGPGGFDDSLYTLGSETVNITNDFTVNGVYPYMDPGIFRVNMGGNINVTGDMDIAFTGVALSSVYFVGYTLTVSGNLDVTSTGMLSSDISSGDLIVSGNLTVNGAFDPGLSTVTLTSSTTSIITTPGTLYFYNLVISNATAKQVQFPTNSLSIIDVANNFTVTGHTAQLIDLYSTSSGTKWHFNPTGTQTVDYARVRDGGCEVTADTITPTNTTDQGNNEFCWDLTKTITFESSDNSVGFGTISTSSSRYANGAGTGSATEVEAHNFSVSTNATGGYSVTVFGATLSRVGGGDSITAIGNTNTAPSVGTEQFGLRAVATGGSGSVNTPYDGSGFAYNGVSSPSQVGSAISGDGATTTYSIRYLGNVAPNTSSGEYTTTLTYIVTGTF